ncbi:MAG: hypothetical protein HOJ16_06940 [Candidatus Peribacter sp.]|jgi:hypothetical protein|nr:hypothetical protein [Candidatus Peribacter sp.]
MSSDYIEMLSGLIREALNHPSEVNESDEQNSIVYEPIVFDPNWMTLSSDALKPRSLKRFELAVQNINPGSIQNLRSFVQKMNQFILEEPSSTTEAVSRAEILRTIYNILGPESATRASSRGYTFEQFLARLFDGEVIDSGVSKDVVDIKFGSQGVSVKFIKPGSKIVGSYTNLLRNPNVKYIVAQKYPGKKISFYEFDVNLEVAQSWKESGFVTPTPSNQSERFSVPLTSVSSTPSYELELGSVVPRTKQIFELLDTRFKQLFTQLRDLVNSADQLAYGHDDRTKEKAAKTKDKADATSRAAEKIQQDS